jgi:hypothetical protein
MNKTQAAEIVATEMRVFARTYGLELTKDLAEARVSELRGRQDGHGIAARIASPKTVLRIAKSQGEL